MTKKDYILIAEAIEKVYDGTDNQRDVIEAVCDALWKDNNKFDESKFLQACGVK